jgi:hypothetical protein
MEETQTVQNPQGGQVNLPNATGILVLGIVSIALCWCYGIIGIASGIIALVMAGKAKALYEANPEGYTLSSFNNLKAGRICAIIGTILSALTLVYVIIVFAIYGAALTQLPWESMGY